MCFVVIRRFAGAGKVGKHKEDNRNRQPSGKPKQIPVKNAPRSQGSAQSEIRNPQSPYSLLSAITVGASSLPSMYLKKDSRKLTIAIEDSLERYLQRHIL